MNIIHNDEVSIPSEVEDEVLAGIMNEFFERFISNFTEVLTKVNWDEVDEFVIKIQIGTRTIEMDAAEFLEKIQNES